MDGIKKETMKVDILDIKDMIIKIEELSSLGEDIIVRRRALDVLPLLMLLSYRMWELERKE